MGPACWFRSSERLTPMIEPGRVSRLGTSEGELVKVPFGRADEAGGGAFRGRLPQLPIRGFHARPLSRGRLHASDIGDLIGDLARQTSTTI